MVLERIVALLLALAGQADRAACAPSTTLRVVPAGRVPAAPQSPRPSEGEKGASACCLGPNTSCAAPPLLPCPPLAAMMHP